MCQCAKTEITRGIENYNEMVSKCNVLLILAIVECTVFGARHIIGKPLSRRSRRTLPHAKVSSTSCAVEQSAGKPRVGLPGLRWRRRPVRRAKTLFFALSSARQRKDGVVRVTALHRGRQGLSSAVLCVSAREKLVELLSVAW